jgi:hypothetical protein
MENALEINSYNIKKHRKIDENNLEPLTDMGIRRKRSNQNTGDLQRRKKKNK